LERKKFQSLGKNDLDRKARMAYLAAHHLVIDSALLTPFGNHSMDAVAIKAALAYSKIEPFGRVCIGLKAMLSTADHLKRRNMEVVLFGEKPKVSLTRPALARKLRRKSSNRSRENRRPPPLGLRNFRGLFLFLEQSSR
jgi:hypothetical protein